MTDISSPNQPFQTRPYRVLHGVTGAAGQANALAQGLRASGIQAENVLIGESRYGYKADYHVRATHRGLSDFLIEHIDRFDIFHMHFRPIFYQNPTSLPFPTFADFPILKAAGKKIVFHFRGSEIRSNAAFAELSPYNYVEEDFGRIISKFPDVSKQRVLDLVRAGADAILANDSEIASYVGDPCDIVNRLLDHEPASRQWRQKARDDLDGSRPLIVHAPSRRGVKGTPWVIDAVEQLQAEGLKFDFKLVENMTHEEAMRAYSDADIVIDQLRIGWYGVLSVEAMSLGKAVLCYIREDLQHTLGEEPPLIMTTREALVEDLRKLIIDEPLRQQLGERAYKFFQTQHSRDVVIPHLIGIYDRVWAAEPVFDPRVFFDLIATQYDQGIYDAEGQKDINAYYPYSRLGKIAYILETQGFGATVKRVTEKLIRPRR